MTIFQRTLSAAAVYGLIAFQAHAASVGVHFWDGVPGNAVTSSAGVVPQNNWVNIAASSATNFALTDNLGNSAGLLTFTGDILPSIQNVNFIAPGDETLMNVGAAKFSSPMSFTITGVPYASYELIVYTFPVNNLVTESATVGATTFFGTSLNGGQTGAGYIDGNGSTPFHFTRATGTSSGTATANANYFDFTGLSGSTLTFSVANLTNGIPDVTGFQIVQTPEPGSGLLLAGGLAVFGVRLRRKA